MPSPESTEGQRFCCPNCGQPAQEIYTRPDPLGTVEGILHTSCVCANQHPWIIRWWEEAS